MKYKITYGKSVHDIKEINAVIEVLKSSTAMGKNVIKFEKKIAKQFAKKYCVMVNSGTSALMLLAELLDLKRGDEFITPVVTFPSTIVPLVKKGLVPKFIDVELKNLQIDISKIEKSITKKTKALVIPNLIGNLPRWDKIKKLADKKKLLLIEDSADTVGSKIFKKKSGIYSDFSITSFYGSHIINCAGNGGALMLNSKKLYLRAKVLRSWGRLSSIIDEKDFKRRFNYKLNGIDYDTKFVFSEMGFNIEPSEMGAAFGLQQLLKLKKNISSRQKNFKQHINFFRNFDNLFILPEIDKNIFTAMLAFPLILKNNLKFTRTELQIFLEKNKIQTRPIFSGDILYHPGFKSFKFKRAEKKFTVANKITKDGLLIGLHHGLKTLDIKYIHKIFRKFISQKYEN
tara:strand:- start:526 stop:1725 length:1200 start_codon:yes stop_codon:yes gene_type:complete